MPRRMSDPVFKQEQWERRFAPHIAPINHLVESLRDLDGRGWLPFVAPMYGGIDALVLSLSRDPGPMTRDGLGSGFLCVENDDPSAEAMCRYYEEFGISPAAAVPWNAYPWYINRHPSAAELAAGLEPLKALLELLPKLRVVMLHGSTAQASWKKFERRYSGYSRSRNLDIISTYHTSRQALWTPDPAERIKRLENLRIAFARAAGVALRTV